MGFWQNFRVLDVIDREDGDILGHGVNVAVRLQEKAIRNGILASIHVVNMLGASFEYERHRRGNIALKNISESIVAFDIEAPDRASFHHIRRWRKLLKKRASFISVLGVLLLGLFWGGTSLVKDQKLNAKIARVENSVFYDRKKTAYQNEIGSGYLHQVLRDLALDLAFNLYLEREIKQALSIMEKYETDMGVRVHDPLWSQYQTEFGIILEADSNLLKSKAVLVAAADEQKKLGDLANLSRTNNVLGLISLREAQATPELSGFYYTSAQSYFEKQLEIDVELERNHSIPEAYYYLGQ